MIKKRLNKVSTFEKKCLRKWTEMSTFAKVKSPKIAELTTFKNILI